MAGRLYTSDVKDYMYFSGIASGIEWNGVIYDQVLVIENIRRIQMTEIQYHITPLPIIYTKEATQIQIPELRAFAGYLNFTIVDPSRKTPYLANSIEMTTGDNIKNNQKLFPGHIVVEFVAWEPDDVYYLDTDGTMMSNPVSFDLDPDYRYDAIVKFRVQQNRANQQDEIYGILKQVQRKRYTNKNI